MTRRNLAALLLSLALSFQLAGLRAPHGLRARTAQIPAAVAITHNPEG